MAGTNSELQASTRPALLFACHPLTGHFTPLFKIAVALHQRGWEIAFLSSQFFRARIEAAGIRYFPLTGKANLDDTKLFTKGDDVTAAQRAPDLWPVPPPAAQVPDNRGQAVHAIPDGWASFKSALVALQWLRDDRPQGQVSKETTQLPSQRRQVVVVCEVFFYGILPLFYGAPLPSDVERPRTIGISVTAPVIRSVDLPPFGVSGGAGFDPSPAGRAVNARLWAQWEVEAQPMAQLLDAKLCEAGATTGTGSPFMNGANYTCHDTTFQLGLPELEFPRADFPPNFRFAGIITPPPPPHSSKKPPFPWWAEVEANSALDPADPSRRKVVVVAQGTVQTDPSELILPAVRALAHRGPGEVLVVCVLGVRGARLPDDDKESPPPALPDNVRVADYLSYDLALAHADLWVHNAGWGAVGHGLANGVPQVVAGNVGQDKIENGRRVAFSGVGLDLACERPDVEELRRAVERVLWEDESFAKRARELGRRARESDCFGVVEMEVERLAGF